MLAQTYDTTSAPAPQEHAPLSRITRRGTAMRRLPGVLRFLLDSPQKVRKERLHWAACRLGDMVAHGEVEKDNALELLIAAAEEMGLSRTDMIGHRGGTETIWSGLRIGYGSAVAA